MPETFELSVVAVMRNEARYVEEWIAYHTVVGVEHFYLYENNSDDDIRAVLRRYINHGLVTMIEFPMHGAQLPAYRHAVHCFGASTQWLAPIDLDEFIVPKTDADVPAMLRRLGPADRVVLPWRNFGMSGHRTRPPGLVIENFRRAEDIPDGGLAEIPIKSIARSRSIVSMGRHSQRISTDRTVDASGRRPELIATRLVRPSYDRAQINHYVTKSEEEFVAKHARGAVNRDLPRRLYAVDDERGFDTLDDSIARFVEPTRNRLKEHRSLSSTPFRYGSQVTMRVTHHDPFMEDVTLSVSNYLHGMRITRNGTRPIANVVDDDRAYVARAEDRHRGPALWPFADSPQFPDLVRRMGAEVPARLEEPVTIAGSPLVIEMEETAHRRHVAAAAVVRCAGPVTLRWSVDSPDQLPDVVTALPDAGRYVCVVEVNRRLSRCSTVAVAVDAIGCVVVDELLVLTYG